MFECGAKRIVTIRKTQTSFNRSVTAALQNPTDGEKVTATSGISLNPTNRIVGFIGSTLAVNYLYARDTMLVGNSGNGVTDNPVGSVSTSTDPTNRTDGAGVNDTTLRTPLFWQTTINFNAAGSGVWDYTNVGTKGHPKLGVGVEP